MTPPREQRLNDDQLQALQWLNGDRNVFVTGAAGSGKSFLMREYLKNRATPVLASTGAAAILVGGRTFHSFFGLGIMEGGSIATVERALNNKRVVSRLRKADAVVIDEISMISGPTLRTAEMIARRSRGNSTPWGGLRVIVVGDFGQLPPVNPHSTVKEWAFLDEVWAQSDFQTVHLKKIMRTSDQKFLEILNQIRQGSVSGAVKDFLDSRTGLAPTGEFTRLFSHRQEVEKHNLKKLQDIAGPATSFETVYQGLEKDIETFRKHSPITEVLHLKKGALIMLRQNDPEGRWVNGSLGLIENISPSSLVVELLSGRRAEIEMSTFTLLDAEGQPVVTAKNFPVSLAWAMTIHKAQGATLDSLLVDLRRVWEPGQAYVALSRASSPQGLFIEGWNPRSIFAAPEVRLFHKLLENQNYSTEPKQESSSI